MDCWPWTETYVCLAMLTRRTATLRKRPSARPEDYERGESLLEILPAGFLLLERTVSLDRQRKTISIRDFRTGETHSVSLLSFTAEVEPFRRGRAE